MKALGCGVDVEGMTMVQYERAGRGEYLRVLLLCRWRSAA